MLGLPAILKFIESVNYIVGWGMGRCGIDFREVSTHKLFKSTSNSCTS